MAYFKTIKIPANKVEQAISDYNLKIYGNIWHYSYNSFIGDHFTLKKKKDGAIILYANPLNSHSPARIYTNDLIMKINIILPNMINGEYDAKEKKNRTIFWFLRINSFKEFLERRSKNSSNPKKHFPSLESYNKYESKINGSMLINEFDKVFFIENYNNLKLPEHLSAEKILETYNKNNPQVTNDMFRIASVCHNDSVVAIALLIDDKKSLSLENIAAKRDTLSFGVFLCTEVIKYCCENDYFSFDAGVSGIYGNYKDKIFLDSKEVIRYRHHKFNKYIIFIKSKFLSF